MSATGHAGGETRPKFRDNLVAQPVEDSGVQYVDVSDPYSGASFRFYDFEYAVAYLMDGTRSPEDVAKSARTELGFETTPEDVSAFAAELTKLGYVTAAAKPPSEFDAHESPTATKDLEPIAKASQLGIEDGPSARKVRPDEASFEGLIDDRKAAAKQEAAKAQEKVEELSSPELVLEPDEPSAPNKLPAVEPVPVPVEPPPIRMPEPPPAPVFAKPQLTLPPTATAPVLHKGSDPVPRVQLPPRPAPKPAAVSAEEPVDEPKRSNAFLYVILVILLLAGFAIFYLKVLKKDKDEAPAKKAPVTKPVGGDKGTPPVGGDKGTPPVGGDKGTKPVGGDKGTEAASYPEEAAVEGSAGGGAAAQVSFSIAGKVNWVVKTGTQVNAGDVVAKQSGLPAVEAKVKDRESSLAGHQKKLDEAKAKDPPNAAKVASEQKDVDRVAGELKAAQEKLDGMVAKAASAGTAKALVQVGDDVAAGKAVVELSGGEPEFGATFTLKTTDTFKADDACQLAVAGAPVPCKVVSADAADGSVKVVVRISNDVPAMPAVGTKVKLLKLSK